LSDFDRALAVCLAYLSHRAEVRSRLLTYVNDGVRAQNTEGSRSTGHAITQDPDGARPTVSDPTGEQAWRRDGFRSLLDDVDQAEAKLLLAANRIIGHAMLHDPIKAGEVLARYRPCDKVTVSHVRAASKPLQAALAHTIDQSTKDVAGKSADGDPGCESCARLKVDGVPWWNVPSYSKGNPTDLGGQLKTKVRLCVPCYRFAINQEPTRLPSVAELKHRHSDPRGHWPKRHEGKAA